jgi:hypothetical protein
MEQQMLAKREEERQAHLNSQKRQELDLRIKEQQFRQKTHQILNEQEERIERKRESLERVMQEKDLHIKE